MIVDVKLFETKNNKHAAFWGAGKIIVLDEFFFIRPCYEIMGVVPFKTYIFKNSE